MREQFHKFFQRRRPVAAPILKNIYDLEPFLKGKSVALVGNAQSLYDKAHPIDDHDVVIRINRGPFANDPEKRAGSRTDILLVSAFRGDEYILSAPAVVWMSPKGRQELTPTELKSMYFYPEPWWEELHSKLGARPSTGCMGIDLVARLIDDGELFLYGFDFWKSPTSYSGQIRPGPHAPSAEELFAKEKVAQSRIIS